MEKNIDKNNTSNKKEQKEHNKKEENKEKKENKHHSPKKEQEKSNENQSFLNKKRKKSQNKKNKSKNKKSNNINHPSKNIQRKLEPIEKIYQKAKSLYEKKSESYDLDKLNYDQKINKDKKWTHDILQKGTFDDKISALLLYIKNTPKLTLKYLEILIKLAENKNRRKNDNVIIGLKDLFLDCILTNKKYLAFNQKYSNIEQNNNINDDELIESYYEDKIHHLYLRFINIIEDTINNENIISIKKKNLGYLYEMFNKQPESEEKILQDIVNKLGDTSTEITNYASKLLNQIQEQNMNMSDILFKYITTFYTSVEKPNAKLCSLIFLTKMEIPLNNNKKFIEDSIDFFLKLFNSLANIESELKPQKIKNGLSKKNIKKQKKKILDEKLSQNLNEKFLSLIVKRLNILLKFAKRHKSHMEKINSIIQEKFSALFRLSHNKSLKLSIEILRLLFGVISTQDQNFVDRYYKSLYELISNNSLSNSKYVKEALKLILLSISFDNNNNRICSFLKRLLEMSLVSEPSYIICILLIISQILRNKTKLWKMLEREQNKINVFYDSSKREPQFAQGEHSFLNELYLLQNHYHPSVQKMSKFILENYNKEIISYDGDPLLDFSLINFLDKFMLKNPKIKKINKENKKPENEEEELKRFIQGEDNNEKKNEKNNNEIEGSENENDNENDFAFIKKFNKIYPQITNDKNYLKKLKKKEKKLKEEDEIDDLLEKNEGNEDTALENYADKVIENEYKKYDKDIDDDIIEGLSEEEENEENENNNEEEDVEDLLTEEENENEENDNEEENENEENDNEEENENENGKEDENEEDDGKGKKMNKIKKKDEEDSLEEAGFMDAEKYYKNLKKQNKKNKNKNKNK